MVAKQLQLFGTKKMDTASMGALNAVVILEQMRRIGEYLQYGLVDAKTEREERASSLRRTAIRD